MLSFISFFIIFLLLFSLWGFYLAVRPIKITSANTPADFGIKYETISFRTKDNILIHGWFIPNANPKAPTIVLLHGYPADKGDILPSRIFLHKNYNLLFFDFRYLGKSEGKYSTAGKEEVHDLSAAIHYLSTRGIHEVGVWGLSMGGAVALMTAENSPEIKAIVIESAYARLDWMAEEYYRIPFLKYPLVTLTQLWAWLFLQYDITQVSPAKSVEKLKIPILLIYSKQDTVISVRHGELLRESLKHNPRAEFIFVEDKRHGESIHNYQKIISDFFDKNLH